ncbi:tyrosine-protein kinase transmembrane receptor Ror-like isoform X2 [Aphis gossypii]|uniref:tyrosine-protein kinase transmembrane receptor Ror-like isoform X2 n=1 Tax=Aphis gossypii TaxID=80765 RepID=UPI00215993BE|nr:tyrosine-protein kinase transmembrane receptor Ror-like isoform X2 [Aphis gossypii]
MYIRHQKRSAKAENGRRFGSCVEKRPCGFEAACRQLENNYYICICPQDLSEPTDDLKCLTRKTVPIAPKSFVNLSINKNEHKPLETVVYPFPTTSQPIKTTLNQTTSLPPSPVVSLIRGVIQEDSYSMNPQYAAPSPVAKDTILIPYLSKSCISSMVEIGQGFFGKVYKGVLKHTDGKYETVAIKVLKDHTNSEAKEDFMREVEIMTYFRHPNILTLIGVCPQEDKCSPWMIFEFMAYGDLTEVLRNSSDQFSHYSEHLPVLDKEALLVISLQIAAGMKYLASQRFVHRDLACRNCLVGNDLTVKIADFGMSRDIYTCDYYKVGGSRLLPVRWMSPESVVYGKFTLESDVWSFGVVLWEIYSLGKQPYYGYSNDEVLKLIHDGVLLDIPLNCPPVICVMMNGCWKSDPKERLRFIDIHERLKNVTKRPELDSPLPRPPTLPVIVDHLSLRKMPSEELLDVDDYLQPDEQRVAVEYIMPYPA